MEKDVLPPNEKLMQARLKADWSIERVAFALNLPSYAIDSLEQGRFSELHGEAFIVGYMKAYAELFDLDAEALVAQYKEEKSAMEQKSLLAAQVGRESSARGEHQKFGTFYGVAAAVTLMAALSMISPSPQPEDAVQKSDSISVETSIGTTIIDSIDLMPENDPTKGVIPQVSWSESVSEDQVAQIMKKRIFGESEESLAVETMNSDLNFRFSADCWVQIMDGDNNLIYSSLQKADDDLQLTGKPPFHITLGYAPGVELSYNGEPVSIDTGNTNIAKLVLGNS